MNKSNHTKTGRAEATIIIISIEPRIKNKQWLIPIQNPTQKPDHILLNTVGITGIITPTCTGLLVLLLNIVNIIIPEQSLDLMIIFVILQL